MATISIETRYSDANIPPDARGPQLAVNSNALWYRIEGINGGAWRRSDFSNNMLLQAALVDLLDGRISHVRPA